LARAVAVRGSVAFWAIGVGEQDKHLHYQLLQVLQRPDSFYCVDAHKPTDLAMLAKLTSPDNILNLYLHQRERRVNGRRQLDSHLLHTKLLLADFADGTAEVWVGSHNFTSYALRGGNMEASVVLTCTPGSDLYQQVAAYLDSIRIHQHTHRFDYARLAEYLELQQFTADAQWEEQIRPVIPMFGDEVGQLAGRTVLLLGDDATDLQGLGAGLGLGEVKRQVLIQAGGLTSGLQFLFEGFVESTGLIEERRPTSTEVGFSSRPYAIRQAGAIPYVAFREREFEQGELGPFKYWANIVIDRRLPNSASLTDPTPPRQARWQRDINETERLRDQIHESVRLPAWMRRRDTPSDAALQRTSPLIEKARALIGRRAAVSEPLPIVYGAVLPDQPMATPGAVATVARVRPEVLSLELVLAPPDQLHAIRAYYEHWVGQRFFTTAVVRHTWAVAPNARLPAVPKAIQRTTLIRRLRLLSG
jgi:hypothetical protein